MPAVPTGRPCHSAPGAWQASSSSVTPRARAISAMAPASHGEPPMWTGSSSFVAGVIAAAIFAGSIWKEAASTSAKTGSAKLAVMALNVATKV